MKMNRSTEQAVFVVLMLALQEGHRPVASSTLARILGVSDSYLKKVLRTLVVAGLVEASPGREGGFALARPVEELTFGDVFTVMESIEAPTTTPELALSIFPPSAHLDRSIALVESTMAHASEAFVQALSDLPLTALLEKGAYEEGSVDWAHRGGAVEG
ncbi:Rrf2 family transcriptional regulator [Actinomyces sp. ZJ308]|uniref:RrF2 family transcriptional regulator n=1 Tax=Actinomyces sp. ZJ308 TaxID=2708342 RepID=UPI00141F983F|nr:Rrf2 family transcriptional regulator [Actinomyces sp. ZJ308]